MLQNTLHLNVSSADVEKPSSEQCFSTLTLPEGGLLWEEPRGQARPGTAPLQGPLLTCCLFTLTPGSVRGLSPRQPFGLLCLINHGPWEKQAILDLGSLS